jgi:cell division septum initiation protein DivIVA
MKNFKEEKMFFDLVLAELNTLEEAKQDLLKENNELARELLLTNEILDSLIEAHRELEAKYEELKETKERVVYTSPIPQEILDDLFGGNYE